MCRTDNETTEIAVRASFADVTTSATRVLVIGGSRVARRVRAKHCRRALARFDSEGSADHPRSDRAASQVEMGSLQDLAPEPQFEERRLHPPGVATLRLSTQHAGLRSPARERTGGAHKRGWHTDRSNTIHPIAISRGNRGPPSVVLFSRHPVR